MANAVAAVPMHTTPWGCDTIKRPLAATVQTYYPGAMIALDASGNATKCSDTAGLKFDGINADSVNLVVTTGASAGDLSVTVERPFRFMMAIASAAAGDEGKPLYAVDDWHVGYSSTNGVFVGWVDQVLDATHVLVRPGYAGVNAANEVITGTSTTSIGASTAAAGTTTADAGALPAGTAAVYPTTGADDTKGVVINAADKVTGRQLFIGNGVSNKILKVYPPSGGTINGAAADAAFSSVSGKGVNIVCLSGAGNTWLAS